VNILLMLVLLAQMKATVTPVPDTSTHFVHVTWNEAVAGTTSILWGTTHTGPYQHIGCTSISKSCDITKMTKGTYYFVAQEKAKNGQISPYSEEITVVIP
jgi:hypothetical protein